MNLDNILTTLLWDKAGKYKDILIEWTIGFIPKIIGAILVLWIWFVIVNILERFIGKVMSKQKLSPLLKNFITSLSNIWLKIMVILASVWVLGVQTSSLVAMLAAAWFAIGMSLSWTLSNFAGWVVILFFKPFKIWDYVEIAWLAWTVKEITIYNTIIRTIDHKTIIIPNSDISNGTMTNYSEEKNRRIDLVIWVSYKEDIDKVKETLLEIVKSEEKVLQDEEVIIWICELSENSVNFHFRFYVKNSDYWDVRYSVMEKVKKIFDKKWISFPFPQRDVHLYKEK